MRILKRAVLVCVVVFILFALVLGASVLVSDDVAWRFTVLKAKLSGKIPEIPLPLLIKWMRPGSPVYVGGLARTSNVNASIVNLHDDRQSAEAGSRVYGRICIECHGDDANGRTGPSLIAAARYLTDWKMFSTVKWGRPKTIMMPQPLSDLEIWQVCAFIRKTAAEHDRGDKAKGEQLPPFQPVSPDMLRTGEPLGDWLTYSGNYAGYRHGSQTQITRANVQHLRLAWAAQLRADSPFLESSPIVTSSRMYVTEAPEGLTALDLRNGSVIWQFHRPVSPDIPLCCGAQNRGVAVLGKSIFLATLDAHLIALDAETGAKLWDVTLGDWRTGYSITGAPLVLDDRIVIGVGGAEFGIRGFLAAFSPADGSMLWKFYTIPGPGEPGHETWGNNSWEHGGVSTWGPGAYDPVLDLIYWGTGNPAPVFYPKGRPGLNLYATSVIALEAKTGKLRWYYQFIPSDSHDWDATQQPVLTDIQWKGQKVPALVVANRNGFFYALDRQTGKFLLAKAFAKQNWCSGFLDDGHAIVRPETDPSPSGTLVWPAAGGATNWWSPSFDPRRGLLFVPSVDSSSIFFNEQVPHFERGVVFDGSGYQRSPNQPITMAVRAIDAATGDIKWDSPFVSGGAEIHAELGGVLSTEGDLVFAGYSTEFIALDADTGKHLWRTPLGGRLHAAPITYTFHGKQYVSVVAGVTVFTFALPDVPDGADVHGSQAISKTSHP